MTDRADEIAGKTWTELDRNLSEGKKPDSFYEALIAAALRDFAKEERERQAINHARLERAESLLGKFAHFRFGHDANCSTDEQKRKAYQEAADYLGLDEVRKRG